MNEKEQSFCKYLGIGCEFKTPCKKAEEEEEEELCSNYQEYGYFCVPYYNCNRMTNVINIDGSGDGGIGPRTIIEPLPSDLDHNKIILSTCDRQLSTCCRHPSGQDPTINDE